jgi:hypothetical protein
MENNFKSNAKKEFNLDFGTVISTSAALQTIEVEIDPELIMKDYARVFTANLQRVNHDKFLDSGITQEKVFDYFKGILKIRVESVQNNCPNWRKAKALYIPAWVQFAISRVGEYIDRKRGLKFVPVYEEQYDLSSMLEFSITLSSWVEDGIDMFKDAFPRDREGDPDTMSLAVIDNYVKGINQVPSINSYIAAFLGFKLKSDNNFAMLYRIRYDDVDFISSSLLNTREIM